jgi:hypothetical protein
MVPMTSNRALPTTRRLGRAWGAPRQVRPLVVTPAAYRSAVARTSPAAQKAPREFKARYWMTFSVPTMLRWISQ